MLKNNTRQLAGVKKVHQSKVYDYIRKVEIDGLPRLRAYAEAIDEKIYNLEPGAANRKLDRVREDYPEYNELREMVLSEQKDWALRKSYVIQDKAISLLVNVLDKANKLVESDDCDPKDLAAANNVLKSIMPAIKAVTDNSGSEAKVNTEDRSARVAKYIN